MCLYCYDTWRGRKSWLFSQSPVLNALCFAGKLQPVVYASSHTQSSYIHNLTANRLPLVLLSYWCTVPVPSVLMIPYLWHDEHVQPVCKYILCIYQDILPWVANCSVYTQGDKSPNYIENQLLTGVDCQHKLYGRQELHRKVTASARNAQRTPLTTLVLPH